MTENPKPPKSPGDPIGSLLCWVCGILFVLSVAIFLFNGFVNGKWDLEEANRQMMSFAWVVGALLVVVFAVPLALALFKEAGEAAGKATDSLTSGNAGEAGRKFGFAVAVAVVGLVLVLLFSAVAPNNPPTPPAPPPQPAPSVGQESGVDPAKERPALP